MVTMTMATLLILRTVAMTIMTMLPQLLVMRTKRRRMVTMVLVTEMPDQRNASCTTCVTRA